MNGWFIFLGVLLLLFLLLLIPVGVCARYDKELRVTLKIGFIPITLYPSKPKKRKKKKKKDNRRRSPPKKRKRKRKKSPGLSSKRDFRG